MRFPPAPAPFTDRITCVGTLSAEDRTTGPLDILIDVSNTAAHGMRGWVLGNKAARDDIKRARGRHHGAMRLNAGAGPETLTSESIWVRTTQTFGADPERMPYGLHGIACAFRCLDLTRRFEGGGDTKGPREVRFLLRGPGVRGLVAWGRGYSFEGTSKVEVYGGGRLATGSGLPFSMFVLPHFLYDGVGGRRTADEDDPATDANVTSETHVLAMACRTRKPADAYGDDAFLSDAQQAVDDMCLLLSLLVGGVITWHGYFQSGAGVSLHYNRSLARSSSAAAQPEEIVSDVRAFLRAAFRRLRRLRADGINLEMPIVSAISGAQADVARQRFGEFFLALEALHSIELERLGETFLLGDSVFKRVKSRLKEPLVAALRTEGERSRKIAEQMTQKLTELNRPALWDGLRRLLVRLRVDWEDLYPVPAPERPTFLKLRNTLFHSHARADDETIYKEAIRVEAVVHRILLRWLGWEDLWDAPRPAVRHYVSGKALPDRHRLSGRITSPTIRIPRTTRMKGGRLNGPTETAAQSRHPQDLRMSAAAVGEVSALVALQLQTEGRHDRVPLLG